MSERCEDTVITVLYFVTTITAEFCSFSEFTAAIWTELGLIHIQFCTAYPTEFHTIFYFSSAGRT